MIQQPQQGQQFQGFKPSGVEKIANAMGFQGNVKDFQQFLQDNPDKQAEMMRYQDVAKKMASGGYVKKYQTGGLNSIGTVAAKRVTDPKLPQGAAVTPYGVPTDPNQSIPTTSAQVGTAPKLEKPSTASIFLEGDRWNFCQQNSIPLLAFSPMKSTRSPVSKHTTV